LAERVQAQIPHVRFGLVLHKERQTFHSATHIVVEGAAATDPGIRGQVQFIFFTLQSPARPETLPDAMKESVDVVGASFVAQSESTDAVSRPNTAGIAALD